MHRFLILNPQNFPVPDEPLSPHLSAYRWQLTMMLSITHRGTGIFLALGSILFTYWLVALASGETAYVQAQACLGSTIGQLALAGWTFSLYFHLCNGVRHLFWDAGYGFELDTTYRSGYAVVLVSLMLTASTWYHVLAGS